MNEKRQFIIMLAIGAVVIIFAIIMQVTGFSPFGSKDVDKSDLTADTEVITDKEKDKINGATEDSEKDYKKIVYDFSGKYELIDIEQEIKYDLVYENSEIFVEFDPHDAVIKSAIVKPTFLTKKEMEHQEKPFDLVQSDKDNAALRLKFGSWEKEVTLSNLTGGKNIYHYEKVGDKFIFTCKIKKIDKNPENEVIYTIEKIYEFYKAQNVFKLDIKITNDKGESIDFDNTDIAFSVGWGPLLGVDSKSGYKNSRQFNLFSYLKGDKLIKVSSKQAGSGGGCRQGKTTKIETLFQNMGKDNDATWVASNGHYFASVIYPDSKNYKYFFDYRDKDNSNYYCGLARDTGGDGLTSFDSSFYIYIGPKVGKSLKNADNFLKNEAKKSNPGLSKLNEVVVFYIGNGIEFVLNGIYKLVKNYGIAIILLTILIKLILFPLTFKTYQSQQKMSKLQPKIKELQNKFKDNPEQLNKETMKLYKKEKINPLGGCLPMMLQMPILMAMWQILNRMVSLKGARFLWIDDLSKPDNLFTFPEKVANFMQQIPLIKISAFNLLPILMVGIQIATSVLTPSGGQSNKQAKMMMWGLPLVFFFIFYNVSSGLVLYWTIMNILNLAQQLLMNYFFKDKIKPAK